MMDIDREAVRRVRDQLLEHAVPEGADLADAMLRRLEPFAETMYLVMMADGAGADQERQALTAALSVLSDAPVPPAAVDGMLDRFEDRARQQGIEQCLARIGAGFEDREDRDTAFTLAAVAALADDRVEVQEHQVLKSVQEYFGLSDRRVTELLGAMD